ncbi:MAG: stage III sporulation protein AG [Oscillospiraceae bacterium]|nr:stage III sporulation protein AG [Oscillospiraceae bacterium]
MQLKNVFEKVKAPDFLKKYKYLLIAVLAGVILLCLPTGEKSDRHTTAAKEVATYDLEETERKLENAISKIDGAGKATVILTLKSDWESVVASDTQAEYSRGEETNESLNVTTVVINGENGEEVVVLEKIYPKYQGALVICQGGDDLWVKSEVLNAVSRLTGLGTDKITVTKMKRD